MFQTVEVQKKNLRPSFISQKEIILNVRVIDTFVPLDTLTVTKELVEDSDKFFILCEKAVGSNFLKVPMSFKRENGKFVCQNPVWFYPIRPTSIAEWIMYYFERAIWI